MRKATLVLAFAALPVSFVVFAVVTSAGQKPAPPLSVEQRTGDDIGDKALLAPDDEKMSLRIGFADNSQLQMAVLPPDLELNYLSSCLWNRFIMCTSQGSYLYAKTYVGLQVYNITTPTSPTLVAQRYIPTGFYGGGWIDIKGTALYYVDRNALTVFDISTPTNPVQTSSTVVAGRPWAVAHSDFANVIGLALSEDGLTDLDVTNPLMPSILGSYIAPTNSYEIRFIDTVAFLGCDNSLIHVLNVANPASPSFIASLDLFDFPWTMQFWGDRCYVAADNQGIVALNTGDPTAPFVIENYFPNGFAASLEVRNDTIFLPDWHAGFQIVYASPASSGIFNQVGMYTFPGDTVAYAHVKGDFAYLCVWPIGLVTMDITPSTSPTPVDTVDGTGYARGVAINGNYVYVGDSVRGVQVVNISNPASPVVVSATNTAGGARDLYVYNDKLFLADGSAGLMVLDISNPDTAADFGSYDTPGSARGVTVRNDTAFVADAAGGVVILDCTSLPALSLVGSYNTLGAARDVAVKNDLLFVADGANGVVILDISNPVSPILVRTEATPGPVNDVAIKDTILVATCGSAGLRLYNIQEPIPPPIVPILVGVHASSNSFGVDIEGNYAFVASDSGGCYAYNIFIPETPVFAGAGLTAGFSIGVDVENGIVVTGDGFGGMVVRSITGCMDSDLDGDCTAVDNCPLHPNPLQEDFDNDGQGDSCYLPNYLSPLTVVARYAPPSPPSPPNPPGDPNVNLKVIDPDGLYIGADSVSVITNTIGLNANYYQVNGNDSVVIVDPKSGNYTIEVIPEDEVGPSDKYLVGIRIDGTVESVDEAKLVPAQGQRDTVFIFNIPYAFGDADGGRDVNIGDALFIISYIFTAGPDPIPLSSADADCGGDINIGDVLLIIDFIFGGPLPDPGCGP